MSVSFFEISCDVPDCLMTIAHGPVRPPFFGWRILRRGWAPADGAWLDGRQRGPRCLCASCKLSNT